MNRNRMKDYYLRKQINKKNNEGSSYLGYDEPFCFQAEIWPASGKIQAEVYGQRLNYILNMLCEDIKDIAEGDGVCVYVDQRDTPDYKIISIKKYDDNRFPHMLCELEKL